MKNKAIIFVLMFASVFIFLPAGSNAAVAERSNSVIAGEFTPQVRVQIGRRNRRGRQWNRGWDNARHNRTRLVRQVYYVNGRRYYRWVRVRY